MMEHEPLIVGANDTKDDSRNSTLFWMKLGFIAVSFTECAVAGMLPTWSESCRKSPKILGIANAFAGGVFLAIAFMHITPEMIETWATIQGNPDKLFPLPELLIFCGYTFILIIDKVLFDSHALFDDEHGEEGHGHTKDPAEQKFEQNLKASMARATAHAENGDVRASRIEQKEGVDDAMTNFLNPSDRFATRMKASMRKGE